MTEKLTNPFEITELINTVNNIVDDKQDTLVSGTNIKTINNESILGSGNITIEGGGDAVWGAITGTLSNQTDLQTVLNAKAADNAVVKLTGNQSIAGTKTFSGNNRITALQNSTVTYNTAPSSDTFTDISFRDKNGYEMGVLEHVRFTNNDTAIRLVAKGADGDWSTSLMVGRKADGTVYTSAQTPSTDDNSTKIATTAFVKNQGYAVDSGLVHTTGNETIAGEKTFSNAISLANGIWNNIGDDVQIGDSNQGGCLCLRGLNNQTGIAFFPQNGTSVANYIKCDGSYLYCITPNFYGSNGYIVTTEWVNTKFQVVSALPASPDSNIYYFIPE